jgi:hypothetical protein
VEKTAKSVEMETREIRKEITQAQHIKKEAAAKVHPHAPMYRGQPTGCSRSFMWQTEGHASLWDSHSAANTRATPGKSTKPQVSLQNKPVEAVTLPRISPTLSRPISNIGPGMESTIYVLRLYCRCQPVARGPG